MVRSQPLHVVYSDNKGSRVIQLQTSWSVVWFSTLLSSVYSTVCTGSSYRYLIKDPQLHNQTSSYRSDHHRATRLHFLTLHEHEYHPLTWQTTCWLSILTHFNLISFFILMWLNNTARVPTHNYLLSPSAGCFSEQSHLQYLRMSTGNISAPHSTFGNILKLDVMCHVHVLPQIVFFSALVISNQCRSVQQNFTFTSRNNLEGFNVN